MLLLRSPPCSKKRKGRLNRLGDRITYTRFFLHSIQHVRGGWEILSKGKSFLKKAEGMFQEMGMDYWVAKTHKVLEGF